jgi:HAD superfamily hydrolase (TIGR01549 family)
LTINAVILDLDGTIATFNLDYKTLRAEARGYMLNMGVPASVLAVNENIFEMLKKTEVFMNNAGKTAVSEEILAGVMGIAEKYELEAASNTSLLPGAVETLKALRKMGLKIGLCTISSRKSTDLILKRFKIGEYFDAITPREKTNHVKPNPEHCQASLQALGISSREAIVVGDSIADMKGAKDLKAIAVGLSTGVSTKEQLIHEGANYIITSITDLPGLVESINKVENASA